MHMLMEKRGKGKKREAYRSHGVFMQAIRRKIRMESGGEGARSKGKERGGGDVILKSFIATSARQSVVRTSCHITSRKCIYARFLQLMFIFLPFFLLSPVPSPPLPSPPPPHIPPPVLLFSFSPSSSFSCHTCILVSLSKLENILAIF